jgi:hypothetical protein
VSGFTAKTLFTTKAQRHKDFIFVSSFKGNWSQTDKPDKDERVFLSKCFFNYYLFLSKEIKPVVLLSFEVTETACITK